MERVRIGVIGAGGLVRGVHLPNCKATAKSTWRGAPA